MKPGIYQISNKDYHASRGLSSTDIKELLKSPLHFQFHKAQLNEPTPEMLFGSITHSLILEPDKFHEEYVIGSHKKRAGGEYERLIKDNPGKTIITSDQHEEACKLVEAFHAQMRDNDELSRLMNGGINEHAFYWEDPSTGILCKVKPDKIVSDGTTIIDVKTARDGSFDAFQKAIVDYGYFISAPFYLRGVKETLRAPIDMRVELPQAPKRFIFVVIESKAPYAVSLYELGENDLKFGEEQIDKALDNYAEAVSTDKWGGYPKTIVPISLPNYVFYKQNYKGVAR